MWNAFCPSSPSIPAFFCADGEQNILPLRLPISIRIFLYAYRLSCRTRLSFDPRYRTLHHSCSIRTCTWPFHFIALLLYVQCQLRGSAECLRYHASKLDISKLSMPCIENIDIMQYIEILVFRYIEAFDTIFRYIEKIDTSIYRSFRCDNQH